MISRWIQFGPSYVHPKPLKPPHHQCFFVFVRYFIGIPANRPAQRHLYSVSSNLPQIGTPLDKPQCLTCSVLPIAENNHDLFLYSHPGQIEVTSRFSSWSDKKEWSEDQELRAENSKSSKSQRRAEEAHRKRKSKAKATKSKIFCFAKIFFVIKTQF